MKSAEEKLNILNHNLKTNQSDIKNLKLRLDQHIIWTQDQFRQIMKALDDLNAPPSTEEAPILQELIERVDAIDQDLSKLESDFYGRNQDQTLRPG